MILLQGICQGKKFNLLQHSTNMVYKENLSLTIQSNLPWTAANVSSTLALKFFFAAEDADRKPL